MKRYFLILFLLIFALPIIAEPNNQGGYVGTPPGFYDDIDPNSLEQEEQEEPEQKQTNRNNYNSGAPSFNEDGTFHEYSEESDINFSAPNSTKATKDYASIYNNLEPATHSYLHGIDPDEFYDEKDAAWSVYPLLRLNSAIYFKNQTIEPGYYLLTPREHKGKWYILFKQNGKVVHIIPVYERGYTPEKFYDEHIPKPKLTKAQKIHMGALKIIGKTKSSKRKEPVKSYLELNDLENYFINIFIYYGGHKYATIFRTIRL